MTEVKVIAPVVSIPVECGLDRMIARDTARRIAGALGFIPAAQAQIGSATLTLVDLLLKTGLPHELDYFGVRDGQRTGMRLYCETSWLSPYPGDRVLRGLHVKLSHLVDDVDFQPGQEPAITLTTWQKA